MTHLLRGLPGLALLLAGCSPDPTTTFFIQSRTEQTLLRRPSESAVARLDRLDEGGTSAYFSSAILPLTASTIHAEGRMSVASGTVELSFTDRDGRVCIFLARPDSPVSWNLDVRALRPREGPNGFLVKLRPLEGPPAEARHIRVEIVYRPS